MRSIERLQVEVLKSRIALHAMKREGLELFVVCHQLDDRLKLNRALDFRRVFDNTTKPRNSARNAAARHLLERSESEPNRARRTVY